MKRLRPSLPPTISGQERHPQLRYEGIYLQRGEGSGVPTCARAAYHSLVIPKPCGCYTFPMKALVISRLGGPDVLEVRSVPEPVSAAGQELVNAEAGGINFADIMSAQGGYPGTPKPPLVAGRDSAEPVSPTATRHGIRPVGRVCRTVTASSQLLWPVPKAWTAEEGAAFPVNSFTAYFAYGRPCRTGRRPTAPRVLIHAVAGGVGTAAVQIGKLLGIEMYGTSSSEEKLARVKALGLQRRDQLQAERLRRSD